MAVQLFENKGWVRWIHEGTMPATTNAGKIFNIALSVLSLGKHCSICLNLNGCCFPKTNMPQYPLHPGCHCVTEAVNGIIPQAEMRIKQIY